MRRLETHALTGSGKAVDSNRRPCNIEYASSWRPTTSFGAGIEGRWG
jgi:hypothetical protein